MQITRVQAHIRCARNPGSLFVLCGINGMIHMMMLQYRYRTLQHLRRTHMNVSIATLDPRSRRVASHSVAYLLTPYIFFSEYLYLEEHGLTCIQTSRWNCSRKSAQDLSKKEEGHLGDACRFGHASLTPSPVIWANLVKI